MDTHLEKKKQFLKIDLVYQFFFLILNRTYAVIVTIWQKLWASKKFSEMSGVTAFLIKLTAQM